VAASTDTEKVTTVTTSQVHTTTIGTDPRYAALRDRGLADTLAAEDLAELDGLDPLERLTCRTHRRWVHECVSAASHVFVVTGHRWCRRCECAANVAVDQLTWDVTVTCPRCLTTPDGAATRQIVRTCRASLAASRGHASEPSRRADRLAA
jgi:hypothetical protein